MEIIERVQVLAADYLHDHKIELVEVIFRREQPGMVLRLLVDKEGGISIDECEALNHFLSDLLDRENVIEEHYQLEVASPGLDRPIKTDRDFERVMGKALTVSMFEPIDGKRSHEGILIGMSKDEIVLESEGVSTAIPRIKIAMARLMIEI